MHLIDLHNDAVTVLSAKRFACYIKATEKCGVETILISVWTTEMKDPVQQIRKYKQIIDSIKTKVKLLMHIEDAWFVNEQNIKELIKLKPFSVGLTWNKKNNLAGGAESDGNLTPEGTRVIETLCKTGILVDLAHLNKPSFYKAAEVLQKSGQRLLCTHTCLAEVNPHARNLDRRQVQTIIDSGGLIGLTFARDFLTSKPSANMHNIYTHIAYFIENFGEDNIAIGTDFFGTVNLPKGIRKYCDFKRLKKFLKKQGLNDTTIDKIFYLNAKKFLES